MLPCACLPLLSLVVPQIRRRERYKHRLARLLADTLSLRHNQLEAVLVGEGPEEREGVVGEEACGTLQRPRRRGATKAADLCIAVVGVGGLQAVVITVDPCALLDGASCTLLGTVPCGSWK